MHLGEWLLESWKPIAQRMKVGVSEKATCQDSPFQSKCELAWVFLHEPGYFASLASLQLCSCDMSVSLLLNER